MRNTVNIEMTEEEVSAFVQMKYLASAMYFALDTRPSAETRSWSSILNAVEPHLRAMEEMLERNKIDTNGNVIRMADKKTY